MKAKTHVIFPRALSGADALPDDTRHQLVETAAEMASRDPVAAAVVALVALAAWEGELADRIADGPIDSGWFLFPLNVAQHLFAAGGTYGAELLVDRAINLAEYSEGDVYSPPFRSMLKPYYELRRAIARRSEQDVGALAWDLREACQPHEPNLRPFVAALLWTLGDVPNAELMSTEPSYVPTADMMRQLVALSVGRTRDDSFLQHIWLAMKDRPPLDLRRHHRVFPHFNVRYRCTPLHQLDETLPSAPSRVYATALVAYFGGGIRPEHLSELAVAAVSVQELVGGVRPLEVLRLQTLWNLVSDLDEDVRQQEWRRLCDFASEILRRSVEQAEFVAFDNCLALPSYYLVGLPADEALDTIEANRVAGLRYWLSASAPPAPAAGHLIEREKNLLDGLRAARFISLLQHLPAPYSRFTTDVRSSLSPDGDLSPVQHPLDPEVAADRMRESWEGLTKLWRQLSTVYAEYGRWRLHPQAGLDEFHAALTERTTSGTPVAPTPMMRSEIWHGRRLAGQLHKASAAERASWWETDRRALPASRTAATTSAERAFDQAALAEDLLDEYRDTKDPKALRRATKAATLATRLADPDSVDQLLYLDRLSMIRGIRYVEFGRDADMRAAIKNHELALTRAAGVDVTDELRQQLLFNAGTNHFHHYRRTGDPANLRRTVEHWAQASRFADAHGVVHQAYARALRELYDQTAAAQLLPDLVEAQRVATERGRPDDPDLPAALGTYAMDLLLLHIEDGEVGPLDRAVSALRRAVELARQNDLQHNLPSLQHNLPSLLNNLAVMLLNRRAATGGDDDLDRAIVALDEAAAMSPIGPLRARLLEALSDLFTQRYTIRQDGADATRAEQLRAEAAGMR
ncbi:MAG: hypothetical protein ACR2GH_18465 [Pseudonocardia sp.]